MSCSIFYSTEMPDERPQITGTLPRRRQRWAIEWLVKTPEGHTHIDHRKTIQHANYQELCQVMGQIIGEIIAEVGTAAAFISWRATAHGGKKKDRKGGKRK